MSRLRLTAAVVASAALLAAGSAPAQAAPAETFTLDDVVATIADDANEMAAFVNSSRATFCTAEQVAAENAFLEWLLGGEVGDPPQFPQAVAAMPLVAREKAVGTGNFRFSFAGPVPLELWTFEVGKSAAEGNLIAPCIDTDGILDLTTTQIGGAALFASGAGSWSFKDNDATGAGPRSNVWGDRISASLSGPGGEYTYGIVFTNHVVRGEYTGSASFTLRQR